MPEFEVLYTFHLFGYSIDLTTAVLYQWIAMLIIIIPVLVIRMKTRKLETIPTGTQNAVETVIGAVNSIVKSIMGEKYANYAPYIGSVAIFLLILNWFGMTGLEPPTSNYSVALGFALTTFFVIQGNAIAKSGVGGYFKAFAKPVSFLLPLNIIERLTVPVSLSLRLFGNITAGAVIMKLIYQFCKWLSGVCHLNPGTEAISFPFLQIAIPVPLHMYFDMFDGTIQVIIFLMLTMVFIRTTAEHGEH